MSIPIRIRDETYAILERHVRAGDFPDIDAALEQAVQLPDVEPMTQEIWDALQPAMAQIERGEGIEFTREVSLQILAEAAALYHAGEQSRQVVN